MITVIYTDGEEYTYSSVEEAEQCILETHNSENIGVRAIYNTFNDRPYKITSQMKSVKLVMEK